MPKINSNISIKRGRLIKGRDMREHFEIKKGDEIVSHNIVLDIGKSYLMRSMAGEFGSQPAVLRYCGIGRSTLPTGGGPAPSSAILVALSDPNPYYISIVNHEMIRTGTRAWPTSTKYTIHIVGTSDIFDHFEAGSTMLSIGELGLFFDSTDKDDPSWGVGPGGKLPYTAFARDQILESIGSPLILERSSTPGVYQAWMITWTVDMI